MKSLLKRSQKGFTIIEVMIVLAIAGLILAIVFIAVPQLQRNSRDNQRENIVSRIKSEIESYAANNGGAYPFQTTGTVNLWSDFYTRYISGPGLAVNDPTTGAQIISSNGTSGTGGKVEPFASGDLRPSSTGVANLVYGAKCNGENVAASGAAVPTTHSYAIIIGLDKTDTYFCVDNG